MKTRPKYHGSADFSPPLPMHCGLLCKWHFFSWQGFWLSLPSKRKQGLNPLSFVILSLWFIKKNSHGFSRKTNLMNVGLWRRLTFHLICYMLFQACQDTIPDVHVMPAARCRVFSVVFLYLQCMFWLSMPSAAFVFMFRSQWSTIFKVRLYENVLNWCRFELLYTKLHMPVKSRCVWSIYLWRSNLESGVIDLYL